MSFQFNPEEYDDTCELCGEPGQLISAVLLTPWGSVNVLIHALCESSQLARELNKRARSKWN